MGCAFRASQLGSTTGECAAVYGPGLEATYLGASAVDYLPYEETCEVNPHAVLECTDGGPEGKCKDSGIDYNAARAAVVAMGVACPSELCESCIVDYCAFGGDTSMIEGCIDDDGIDGTLPKGHPSPPPIQPTEIRATSETFSWKTFKPCIGDMFPHVVANVQATGGGE